MIKFIHFLKFLLNFCISNLINTKDYKIFIKTYFSSYKVTPLNNSQALTSASHFLNYSTNSFPSHNTKLELDFFCVILPCRIESRRAREESKKKVLYRNTKNSSSLLLIAMLQLIRM